MIRILTTISLMLLLSGCTTAPAPVIRSEAFLRPGAIQTILQMPTATEVSISPEFDFEPVALKQGIHENLERMDRLISIVLEQRGYALIQDPTISTGGDAEANRMVLDYVRESNQIIESSIVLEKANDGRKEFRLKTQDPSEGVTYAELADKADALLFLQISSHVAKRNFWGRITDESFSTVSVEIRIPATGKVAYRKVSRDKKTDILDLDSTQALFSKALAQIPLKLRGLQ